MKNKTAGYSEFFLRRLHSLTGLVPLTIFIFFHFFAISYSTVGEDAFNKTVDTLRGLPMLIAVEWGFLFIPFLLHMFLGVWITMTGRPNSFQFNTRRNWAYFLQRATAMVVFVFIFYHVVTLHYIAGHRMEDEGRINFFTHLHSELRRPAVYILYVVGIASTVFHLANGICTFLMTWGFTVGRKAQRYTAYAMTALGLAVFGLGMSALHGFIWQVKKESKAVASTATPGADFAQKAKLPR